MLACAGVDVVVMARLAMGEGVTPRGAVVRLPRPVPVMTMALLFFPPPTLPANLDRVTRNAAKDASSKMSTFLVNECASHASTSSFADRCNDCERPATFVSSDDERGGWPAE